jgi:hypothetical protein
VLIVPFLTRLPTVAPQFQAGWILMDVLESNVDYLIRYHCAEALIRLMPLSDVEPVQLSADWPTRSDRLACVQAELRRRVPRA